MASVTVDVLGSEGETLIFVTNGETITLPDCQDDSAAMDVLRSVLERLGEDVLKRALDQTRDFVG